ncbi:MAG: hypothetical protein J6L85_06845 [Clostridia bacterium]|nr:hypothetical protein [Clostridia bacterium]
MFKRLICLFLVLCFVGLALVGCSKKQGEGTEGEGAGENGGNAGTQQPTNEYGELSFTTAVPVDDLDFEEAELVILLRNNIQNSREWYKETIEDELDEAIAMRNEAVEDALNVKMDFEWLPSDHGPYINSLNEMIRNDVLSDLHYYDIGSNFSYYCASSVIRDFAANLLDTSQFPYFNFEVPCWNQAIVEDTTFNERLHYVAGDINISMFDAAIVIWHNKTLYDAKKDSTDPENMQQLALDGNWTYEELYGWATKFQENVNGIEGKQPDDNYGFGTFGLNPCPADALPYAWDLDFVIENDDQTHTFNIENNKKGDEALTKFKNLLAANGSVTSIPGNQANVKHFAAGHYVFFTDRIYWSYDQNMAIREMNDKYGLLPLPKYDTDQENYGTTSQDYYNLLMIIDHEESTEPTKGDAISAFLQLATEESYTGVRGYYFNRIIKPKFFGTDDSEGTVTKSQALFDIIIENIEFDYMTVYSPQLADVNHLWRNACYSNDSLSARYSEQREKYENAIKETDIWLGLRDAE